MAVRNPELGGPNVLGNRAIPTVARVAALDCLLDDIGTELPPVHADMIIDYAASRFERGEVQGALDTLRYQAGIDYIGALRIAAVMHTEGS